MPVFSAALDFDHWGLGIEYNRRLSPAIFVLLGPVLLAAVWEPRRAAPR